MNAIRPVPYLALLALCYAPAAWADPVIDQCNGSDNPVSSTAECAFGPGVIKVDTCQFVDNTSGTFPDQPASWVECDLTTPCGSSAATAYGVLFDDSGSEYQWAVWGTCGATSFCCSITEEDLGGGDYWPDAIGIQGTSGNDSLNLQYSTTHNMSAGQNGNLFYGRLYGQDGTDTLLGSKTNAPSSYVDFIHGGVGDDTITGDNGPDQLYGDGGNDQIFGGRADDTIYGGAGNDELHGDQDNDLIWGENGTDMLAGQNGSDTLHGGADQDLLCDGNVNFSGDPHDCPGEDDFLDTFVCGTETVGAVDHLRGNNGDDCLFATNGNDRLWGGADKDFLTGGDGNDLICDISGTNDEALGGDGNDEIGMFGTTPTIDCGAGGGDAYPGGTSCTTATFGDAETFCGL